MGSITTIVLVALLACWMVLAIPVKRDAPPPSNTHICSGIYHGQCIDTYKYKCNGLLIPGVCGNMTHFNSIDFGAMTVIQCCNGWKIDQIAQSGK